MLYKFKSKAAGDVIMLQPNGRQILQLIGKNDPDQLVKGILLPDEMPAAIAQLKKAIADAQERAQRRKEAQQNGEEEIFGTNEDDVVGLRQRAAPFLAMLQRCYQADKEVVWGV